MEANSVRLNDCLTLRRGYFIIGHIGELLAVFPYAVKYNYRIIYDVADDGQQSRYKGRIKLYLEQGHNRYGYKNIVQQPYNSRNP